MQCVVEFRSQRRGAVACIQILTRLHLKLRALHQSLSVGLGAHRHSVIDLRYYRRNHSASQQTRTQGRWQPVSILIPPSEPDRQGVYRPARHERRTQHLSRPDIAILESESLLEALQDDMAPVARHLLVVVQLQFAAKRIGQPTVSTKSTVYSVCRPMSGGREQQPSLTRSTDLNLLVSAS